ncbi:MAG: outer membrane protein assembly factor BamB [Sulfuricaulis sp.]
MRAAVVICALLLTACGGSKVVREEPAKLQDFVTDMRVKEVWSADTGASAADKGIKLSPALDGKVIYTSDPKGQVSAFEADTGHRMWNVRVHRPVTGAIAVGDDLVVVATKKGEVVALNRADGHQLWNDNVSSEVLAPVAIQAGVVVAQSVDGELTGLAEAGGKKIWTYERLEPALSLYGTATPVIADDVVLTGFASGKIVAIQVHDGKLLWEMSVAEPHGRNEVERLVDVDASPLVVGNVLFAASYQGKVIAVDLPTNRILWSRDMSTFTGMDADTKNLYITDDHSDVIALDQQTGVSVWKQDNLRARQLNAPRYVDGTVAVGDFDGYIHWLSTADGHFVARYRVTHSPIRAQAQVSGNTLYVSSQSGELAALRLEKK